MLTDLPAFPPDLHAEASALEPMLLGLALAAGFALAALAMRTVTRGGAAAGVVVAWLLYLAAGLGGFLLLALVFVLAVITTRLGYARKLVLGTAESRGGRSGVQVLANLGAAAAGAAMSVSTGEPLWMGAGVAALAEAAADTASSESGQATRATVYLITTGERVPPGTDGGVSLPGTLAGMAAAAALALAAAVLNVIPWAWSGAVAGAAVLGMFADSFLGALLERRGALNNEAVNLLSTLLAGTLAWLLLR